MERSYHPCRDVYKKLLELLRQKKPVALATIIEARGSTPQVPGSAALFSGEGLVCGTVGGGSAERGIEILAGRAIRQRESTIRLFRLDEDLSEEAEGVCGGRLRILIDAQPEKHISVFRRLAAAAGERKSGALAVWINRSRRGRVVDIARYWIPEKPSGEISVPHVLDDFKGAIAESVRDGTPVLERRGSRWLFVEPHFPAEALVVVGGGHVGRAVARLGKFLGFEVTVLDDRPEFANEKRFPEADRVIAADIERTLKDYPISTETYIVIVTRGHRSDALALRTCIKSAASYIGMIGSRRKIELLREKFIRSGWCSAEEWARVHAPIGLPIGSRTVEEIAVSIASELVLVRGKAHAREKTR
jgi:xanthine dehydrogenase accessory factor